MSTIKSPVTYATRPRAQSTAAPSTSVSLPSSPLADLSPSKHDVPLSEMTRRMKKRSRQVSSGRTDSFSYDASSRSVKKLKRRSQGDLREAAQVPLAPTVPSTPVTAHSALSFPLDTQQVYDSLFETPLCTTQDTVMQSYFQPIAGEDFSPVPVARRMLSRTSSRNFKENRKSLASPFSSRPGSRASSPKRYSKTPAKPLQNKSRTLSSSNVNQHRKSASISQYTHSQIEDSKDSIFDSIHSSTQAPASHTTHSHTRTGSIPTVSSSLLDHISTQDWLIPPKALSRSPPSLEDMELDDFAAEHPSFYLDAPVQASSPPRRRRTTVSLRDFRPIVSNRSQSDSVLQDSTQRRSVNEDTTMTDDSAPSSPSRPRARRRTVVHMSSDSIFSSALDFSAYMTEGSPTKVHKIIAPTISQLDSLAEIPATTPQSQPPPGLDPAFSLAPVFVPPPQAIPESISEHTSPVAPMSFARPVPPTPYVSRPSLSRRARSMQESPENNKLYEMLSSLGLHETESSLQEQNDSGVGLEEFIPEESVSRRKRGDTIRASDYARPPLRPSLSLDVGSSASAAPRLSTRKVGPPPTRTRSGTITLANARTQPVASPPRPARNSRRKGGLPTIKMKIDDDPLPPQGSDEEDDELLLRADVFWKDPE